MHPVSHTKRLLTKPLSLEPQIRLNSKSKQQGFMLLDVLISLIIIGIVAGMGMATFLAVRDTEQQVQAEREALVSLQRAMGFIDRDIQQMIARPVRDEFGDELPALSIDSNNDYLLEFTRSGWPNPIDAKRSELQRVAYRLEENKLYRTYWLHLDRAQGSEPIEAVLLDDVDDFSVSAIGSVDTQPNTTSTVISDITENETSDTWPTDTSTAGTNQSNIADLPVALELVLETKRYGMIKRLIRIK